MTAIESAIRKPDLGLFLTDIPRASFELSLLPFALLPLATLPDGDGHPVLVLPGLMTSDLSTIVLRRFLRLKGYDAHAWKLGRNLGPRSGGELAEKIEARIEQLHEQTGRKVSLVGWSLGGIMSRLHAQKNPDRIRQIITLGSPFTGNAHATHATKVYERVSGDKLHARLPKGEAAQESHPVPVPSTAIYSRLDGITAWRNCLEADENEQTENVELYGSHFGLVVNPAALFVIADRLAQEEGAWRPFDRSGRRAPFYPNTASH